MARWKRVLLCLCVLIVAAIGFIVWYNRGGSKPSVSVSFIGYTNGPMMAMAGSGRPIGVSSRSFAPNVSPRSLMGVVRVTNTGPAAVYLWGVFPAGMVTNKYAQIRILAIFSKTGVMPTGWGPQILEPGKAFDAHVLIAATQTDAQSVLKTDPWSADVFFGEYGSRECFYCWAYSSKISKIRSWIDKTDPKSELSTIKFGPITNQLPASVSPSRN